MSVKGIEKEMDQHPVEPWDQPTQMVLQANFRMDFATNPSRQLRKKVSNCMEATTATHWVIVWWGQGRMDGEGR
jgi:hypothetical protein